MPFRLFKKNNLQSENIAGDSQGKPAFIRIENLVKSYKTAAGEFPVLKNINLQFNQGDFVGVIGKSGSGKTTLINMVTGIDRPTSGEVWVGDTPLHKLSEGQMAVWRGRNLGIVFQFFQLLPMLSLVENVMLPMDFCNMFRGRQRKERAMELLSMVDMTDHANKLPSAISGGQQQRVAIARALANDPPLIIADEPTGNLDSRTAEAVFQMFEKLVAQGKTFIIVTHDSGLAKRVRRTALIADGEIVNEYVARALPTLSHQLMLSASHDLQPVTFQPGEVIFKQDTAGDRFYIVTRGTVDVVLHRENASDVIVAQLGPGQYFGEIDLLEGGGRTATVRASEHNPVEVLSMTRDAFQQLMVESDTTRDALVRVAEERRSANIANQR